jgi:two-component system sensor histidine kinase YesM
MKIPKLIIQPLVENAIIHGIEPTGETGTILIDIKKTIDETGTWGLIAIEDTGIGFTLLMMKKGVGLSNVERRLHLCYSNQSEHRKAGLRILSEPGQGCRIELKVPLELKSV